MPWSAVIGSPINHSLSPTIHRAAWKSLGIDSTWNYYALEQTADTLPSFISTLDADCVGLSITMPCKHAVMQHLDAIDPLAEAVGAVNTVIPAGGILTGFNTDVHGMSSALVESLKTQGLPLPQRALVLGSGATASSALAALGTLGATDITVAARRFGGPYSVVTAAHRLGLSIHQVMWQRTQDVLRAIERADIVLSTLPAGVADELAPHVMPRAEQTLLDVVYAPRITALVKHWSDHNGNIAWGSEMLLHQAALQVRLMTGREPDIAPMRHALMSIREGENSS